LPEDRVPRTEVEIVNKLGLHARASARLTQLAGTFPCEVWMERNGRRINAKSIMGVMMLAAGKGAKVVIDTEGELADQALEALVRLVADRFGEDE
jgi:phosphocarrier protein